MRDHEKTAEIVLEAIRLSSYSFKQDLGQPFTVPIFLNFKGMTDNDPSILLDITDSINIKNDVLKIYASQIIDNSWECSRVLNRNLYLGSYFQKGNKTYAENYILNKKWPLKISNKLLKTILE